MNLIDTPCSNKLEFQNDYLIKELLLVVPTSCCIYDCPFCPTKKLDNSHIANLYANNNISSSVKYEYSERFKFAKDNGYHKLLITGTAEPLQNIGFLNFISKVYLEPTNRFNWFELESTGYLLGKTEILKWLYEKIKVKTISLTVLNIFDDRINNFLRNANATQADSLLTICKKIKDFGFNLRLNLIAGLQHGSEIFNPANLLRRSKELNADEIVFTTLRLGRELNQNDWISKFLLPNELYGNIRKFINTEGHEASNIYSHSETFRYDGINVILPKIYDEKFPVNEKLIINENVRLCSGSILSKFLLF
ncbi:MAG: radical SAM protein [Bacteroidetes bacterium]|nr:radical SAM protein [Bacteroidota bacterium]